MNVAFYFFDFFFGFLFFCFDFFDLDAFEKRNLYLVLDGMDEFKVLNRMMSKWYKKKFRNIHAGFFP